MLAALVACSAKSSARESSYAAEYSSGAGMKAAYDAPMMAEDEASMMGDYESPVAVNTSASVMKGDDEALLDATARKLIRDANLTVETKEFEQLLTSLDEQIRSMGGYVESMSQSGNSYRNARSGYNRYAYFTARIPANRLDAFLNVVDGLGNVTSKGVSTRDVTSSYVDIESRLKVLETEKESLQKIMAAAETTTDMLETQSRLYDVIEEIEAYEAQKRTYDSLISYSTVSINVQEVVDLTPAPEETRGEELARRFTTSLGDLGEAIVDFCIDFLVALPWLLVIGGVLTGIFLAIFLPLRHKAKKRKAAKEAKTEAK